MGPMAAPTINAQSPFSNYSVGDIVAEASAPLSPGREVATQIDAEFGNVPVLMDGYRPQPGDHVDRLVADFVNEPEHAAYRALFCRLGSGMYMYGTQRTCLRVQPTTSRLEALHGSEWLGIEKYVQRLQRSQGVHLRRGR